MNNQQLINPFSLSKIIISEVSLIAGVWTLTTPVEDSTCFDLGNLHTEGFDSNTSEEIIKNSADQTAYSKFSLAPFTEGIMMERGKTKRDYLRYGCIGKYHLQVHCQGTVNPAGTVKYQEELAIGQIVPQDNNSFPSGATSYKYKFNKIVMEADTVISQANLTAIEACFTPDLVIRATGPATILTGRTDVLIET